MKALTSLIGLGLVSALTAQSPLTTLFTGPNGLANGGVTFFNMTINVPAITVNRIDVNSNSAAGTQGKVRVWQTVTGIPFHSGSEVNYANWQVLGEGSVIAAGANLPSTVCFPVPFTLTSAMGGRGYAVEYIGVGPAYTNGTGANQIYNNAEISLTAGVAASNGAYGDAPVLGGNVSMPFSTALAGGGAARVFNGAIHYAVGSSAPVCSFSDKVGNACGGGYASWFNITPTPAQASAALQGKTIQMVPNLSGAYDVNVLPAGPLVPYAAHTALTGYATTIAGAVATDDGEVSVPVPGGFTYFNGGAGSAVANNLVVHTNGMVSVASNLTYLDGLGGDDWAPTTTALLAAPNAAWYCWHDFDTTTAGTIRHDDNGTQIVITYDAVPNIVTPTQVSTFQLVFDRSTLQITMTFLTVDVNIPAPNNYSGNPWLVGFSPGGASVRPAYQLDTNLFTSQFGSSLDAAHMALTSTPRPVFGSIIDYSTANLSAAFPLGFLYFSVTNPFAPAGLPLSFLGIGKPGCLLNFDLANAIGPFSFAAAGLAFSLNTNTVAPSVLGLDFWGQALTVDLLAPDVFASMVTSNALHQRIEAN